MEHRDKPVGSLHACVPEICRPWQVVRKRWQQGGDGSSGDYSAGCPVARPHGPQQDRKPGEGSGIVKLRQGAQQPVYAVYAAALATGGSGRYFSREAASLPAGITAATGTVSAAPAEPGEQRVVLSVWGDIWRGTRVIPACAHFR
jgi:hypothetical protein